MKRISKAELIRRDAEFKAVVAVLGIAAICLTPGVLFIIALVKRIGL